VLTKNPLRCEYTCTNDRYIAAFKAATQYGNNLLYVVAKDEAENVDWNQYASAIFTANTISPGIPLNLQVTDTTNRASNIILLL
jgi:PKD repeat protein